MRCHFITIPVFDSAAAEAELNRFLGSHRVLAVDRQLVVDGGRSAWAVCVSYVERPAEAAAPVALGKAGGASVGASERGSREAVDYRRVLSPEDFALYARLRALRKRLAERDGKPVYAISSNEQLAAIARTRPTSITALGRVPGLGKARTEHYGAALVAEVMAEATTETTAVGTAEPTVAGSSTARGAAEASAVESEAVGGAA